MDSLQRRFVVLILAGIACAAVVVGTISIMTIVQKTDHDAASIMNLTCENEAQSINATLESIQESVDIEVSYALDRLESAERFVNDEQYRKDYTASVEGLFIDVANDTSGAISFYYRYNADLISSTQGFLYGRPTTEAPFEQIELTDLSLYSQSDDEHVGWYYIPLRRGKATWLSPYNNKNLGIYMISYVVPLYADGTFLGVVGMDVNFQVIVDQLGSLSPYLGGYAALVDEGGNVFLDSASLEGAGGEAARNLGGALVGDSSGTSLVSYGKAGAEQRLAYRPLGNGMRLVLAASSDAIDAGRNQLATRIVVATAAIVAAFAVVGSLMSQQVLRPLRQLTEAAREVADGNLDVEIPRTTTSEVSTLVDAYRRTVQRLREQVSRSNTLAHTDGLTQLANKVSYMEAEERLDARIAKGDASFALVVLDVNDLKVVNDTCGHKRGDEYLVNAANIMRKAFDPCPVFRMGGDEFVVLVENDQLSNLSRMTQLIEEQNKQAATSGAVPWERVSLAVGVARFDRACDGDASHCFARADRCMYERKRQMKSA